MPDGHTASARGMVLGCQNMGIVEMGITLVGDFGGRRPRWGTL